MDFPFIVTTAAGATAALAAVAVAALLIVRRLSALKRKATAEEENSTDSSEKTMSAFTMATNRERKAHDVRKDEGTHEEWHVEDQRMHEELESTDRGPPDAPHHGARPAKGGPVDRKAPARAAW
jgi:hypothetical protein